MENYENKPQSSQSPNRVSCGATRVSCFSRQRWSIYKPVCKTYLIIGLGSHDKSKDVIAVL